MRTWLVLAIVAIVTSCGRPPPGNGKPKVVVSIFPIYDVVRRIAGDRMTVLLVLPPGRSEHGYDPTPKEIARLEGAKLAIAVGLDMDGWVEQIMTTAGGGAKVVRVGDKATPLPIEVEPIGGGAHDEHDHGSSAPDPHVWLDPARMQTIADVIAAELTAIDPAGKDLYATNAAVMKAELGALDGFIATQAGAWSKRTIVTFHGSMAYFARRYNVTIAAVVEPIAGKEPTATYIAEVIGAIQRSDAAALFTEPQLERGPGETIAREAGVPLGELDPIGGVPGRDSYEALLRWNANQLERVLK